MNDLIPGYVASGLLDVSWWVLIVVLFALTQITVQGVTLYLHRCQAHRGVDLHPTVSHFFRLWLWLTTGMITGEWVAIHRKHHARCETQDDPHSPQILGITKVCLQGAELYRLARKNRDAINRYSHGTPDDWLETNLYAAYPWLGPTLMALIDVVLFGAMGLALWALQMIWMPLFAAGVINGLGHWVGYRTYETGDKSHNLTPWGAFLGGEELHNNHHAFPSSARFSMRPWEFDSGWQVLRLLKLLKLAKVRRLPPQLSRDEAKSQVDQETLAAIFAHRFEIMREYCQGVIAPTLDGAIGEKVVSKLGMVRRQAKQLLTRDLTFADQTARERLDHLLRSDALIHTIYEYQTRLRKLWDRSSTNPDQLLAALQQWCAEAEASGIRVLQDFSVSLKHYRTNPDPTLG